MNPRAVWVMEHSLKTIAILGMMGCVGFLLFIVLISL